MNDTIPRSWRDPRYLATVAGLLVFGALLFYAGLTDGAPDPQSVALLGVIVGVVGYLWQYLSARLS